MKKTLLTLLIILVLPLSAKILISPIDAMKQSFGASAKIVKKNIVLKNKEVKIIQKTSKVKLKTKIFRTYKASKNGKNLGYGILINKKVRSKNGVILYIISKNNILKSIEIIAFNEPHEYIPSKKWISQFKDIKTDEQLRVGRQIPTITGATMSARSITDGSRVAFAIYHELLKK
ncbi:FMN-binding protein [Sulfurimonas sp.]|uniref:FMN-binding protein n=1 Tax=Sulfurimonas sp. TaxID=2022749 RepID=UPI002B48CFF7|nr:FMN-binding protein [Sulfurimonas sp.]